MIGRNNKNEVNAKIMEELPAGALTIIKSMRSEYENKIKEKDNMIAALARENEALAKENRQLRKDYIVLNGVLAESMITAFEMWREILAFL